PQLSCPAGLAAAARGTPATSPNPATASSSRRETRIPLPPGTDAPASPDGAPICLLHAAPLRLSEPCAQCRPPMRECSSLFREEAHATKGQVSARPLGAIPGGARPGSRPPGAWCRDREAPLRLVLADQPGDGPHHGL